ncbi:MAG: radical SAM/SPASM domain-containing protein [Patescibacteria group bacterium]
MYSKNSKELLSQEVPVVFTPDKNGKLFPAGYRNDVRWWGNILEEELHSCLPDGTAKMFTMDFNLGKRCSLNCPHCFVPELKGTAVTQEELLGYFEEGVELGLREAKWLGEGDPFEYPRAVEFIEKANALGVGISIFTKGHTLGSDTLAQRYYKMPAIEIVQRLKELDASILLGFNSFDRKQQERWVGVDAYPDSALLKNYVQFRDQALINLARAEFNEHVPGQATRLAFSCAPFKPENISEVFEMFTWARARNIYFVTCPSAESGKGLDELRREQPNYDEYLGEMAGLYVQMSIWAIETGLISLEKYKKHGQGLYPGAHVCNQTAAGVEIFCDGTVNQCPGRCDESTIFCHDIRKSTLRDVWVNSANYRRAKFGKRFNWRCPARDGRSLPHNFYSRIEEPVLANFS